MRKLSDEELAEPDVELMVPYDNDLTDEIRNELRFYNGQPMMGVKSKKMFTRYIIPAYKFREWEEIMLRVRGEM